jgi:hypothetical protein
MDLSHLMNNYKETYYLHGAENIAVAAKGKPK